MSNVLRKKIKKMAQEENDEFPPEFLVVPSNLREQHDFFTDTEDLPQSDLEPSFFKQEPSDKIQKGRMNGQR